MDQIDDDGGSDILSYHLQRTEPGGSTFFDVVGSNQNMTLNTEAQVTALQKRRSYRFRYRAINSVGPSGWSEEAFLVPAIKPERPPQPVYGSSGDDEIVLALARSPDDGGLPITDYELHMDDGLLGTEFTKIEDYDY